MATGSLTTEHGTSGGPSLGHARLSDGLGRLDERLKGRTHWWIITLATLLAWAVRFDQDDAFISYRYARNLARGHGLVFTPGQRVEGYTNFLWTTLLSIPERFGWPVVAFGQVLGLCAFVASLMLALRLFERFLPDRGRQILALLVLCANMTFLAYATGGMETMLQTALLLGLAVLLLPSERVPLARTSIWVAAGLLGGLALLARLDSAVLVVAVVAVAVVPHLRSERDRLTVSRSVLLRVWWGAAAGAVVVIPWLVWKLDFYGSVIPNTYVAKSGAPLLARVIYGAVYILVFFLSYGAFLLVPRIRDVWRDRRSFEALLPALLLSAAWMLYIVWVGADFMEFRFMVPVIPYLAAIGAVVIDPVTRWSRYLVAALLLMSVLHRVVAVPGIPVMSIAALDESVRPDALPRFGSELAEWLESDDPGDSPVIATTTLGAIGYATDMRVIDMIGLTDPEIAEDGAPYKYYFPGHVRIATVRQLLDRGVDLVLGTPLPTRPAPADARSYDIRELVSRWPVVDLGQLPEDARVIEIPYSEDRVLLAIELRRNPVVDAAVEREGWRTFAIDRSCDGPPPPDLVVDVVSMTNGTATCGG